MQNGAKQALELLNNGQFPQNDWAMLSPENAEIRQFVHYCLFNHKELAEKLCNKHNVIKDRIHHSLTEYTPSSFNSAKKLNKENRLACELEFYNTVIQLDKLL
jgi:hypothetical protein